MSYKEIFKNWKVLLLLFLVVYFLIFQISPQVFGVEGVSIRSIGVNSSAAGAGLENPNPNSKPLDKERIISINGEAITSIEEYYNIESTLQPNRTVRIETDERIYTLLTNPQGKVDLGMNVYAAPTSNLKKGLDLEGGTRVLLQPETAITEDQLELTIDNLQERLNVYGLSDVVVRSASDLAGEKFILVEMAGVTEDEVKELIAKQGKFEAKITNETVFFGGKKDITYVCRSAECSGLDPRRGCSQSGDGWACSFFFSITLSPDAAAAQAGATGKLSTVREGNQCYLSDDIVLFLDDTQVDTLRIGCELQGRATTDIQISGSGAGRTREEASSNAMQNMKQLQTVIATGSLPVKLQITKLDTISPSLGKEFLDNMFLVGFLVLLSVSVVVFLRYRKIKVVGPMLFTLVSEIVLILGFAALVGWNLDLASIAGIIIVAGTGVDHLIVITDETLRGEMISDWKKRIKNAMFIVMGAYLTTVSGMIPLWFAGAGLLKGFAFTTIVGISFGVLIARPAFAVMIEKLLSD